MRSLRIKCLDREIKYVCLNCFHEVDHLDHYCSECGIRIHEKESLDRLEGVVSELVKLRFVKGL